MNNIYKEDGWCGCKDRLTDARTEIWPKRKGTIMRKFIFMLLVSWFVTSGVAQAQTLDQEMSGLADKISKSLVAQGYKNVAAIDFTDLQGQPTELGRFLSEELAVEIVSTAGVSMVDRANIKSILAEHKLTEAGLVDPANAKKLGEFAGVDAILIGNVTMLDDGIILMVKAIATSSAKIVAAGKIKFTKTSEIQQLLNRGISSNMISSTTSVADNGTSYQDANSIATKDIGSLRVVLNSVLPMKLTGRNGQNLSGIRCSFEFINRETQKPLVVAANAEAGRTPPGAVMYTGNASPMGTAIGNVLRTTLLDNRGTEWNVSSVTGLGWVSPGQNEMYQAFSPSDIPDLLKRQEATDTNTFRDRWGKNKNFIFGSMTPVPPGQSVTVVMNFVQDDSETTSGTQPTYFQVNSEIVVGVETTGGTKVYSLHNLMFDRVSMPGRK